MFSYLFTAEGVHPASENQDYHPLEGFDDEQTRNQSNFFAEEGVGGGMAYLLSDDQTCFMRSITMDGNGFDGVPGSVQLSDIPEAAVKTEVEESLVSEISEIQKKASHLPSTALELLQKYMMSYDHSSDERINNCNIKESCLIEGGRELSTEQVMRLAAARFIQQSISAEGDPSNPMHPFGISYSGLTDEEKKDVDLAILLLSATEKVSTQNYDRATNLLTQCYRLSSSTGNTVRRVVYYFSIALQDRIDRDFEKLPSKRPREWGIGGHDLNRSLLDKDLMKLTTHKSLPFSQIMQFTSIQTIIDNLASATKIHVVDLCIRHGLQWIILMQALATRSKPPVDYLKISAIAASEEAIAETGRWLVSFAKTLGLPFTFKAVIATDAKYLEEDMFGIKKGEAVAVYSSMYMNTMIATPDSLQCLMRVLRKLKPRIMTIMDTEAKHNSPSFINRFTECLFYHSALFDCLDSFLDGNDPARLVIEGCLSLAGIRSIIASEGSDRVVRHVGISVWRSFFQRFGFAEAELSEWSPYMASLLVKQFDHGISCTLVRNGKPMMVVWKGTPLLFISAWKFPLI